MSIINYDEEITICELFEENVFFDETNAKKCHYFVNRYMRYVIDEKKVVRTQLFDTKARLHRITTSQ